MKTITFIMNPISGTVKKSAIPAAIEEQLDHQLFTHQILETQYAGHAEELARIEREKGTDIVVAVGGDGTVNEVARAIVNSQTSLGIIPCGSGNGLARHLMLPLDVKKSIQIINECQIHDLDYGIINDHPFFCTCGMGFDAFISMKFANAGKRGPVTYIENVLREGLSYQPETYVIDDEERKKRYKAFLISCANASQYGNNAYIAPKASMSDGLLDVIIMEPFNAIEAPQVAIEMMNKTLDNNLKIKSFRTKHIHIKREKEGYIHYDGDPVMTTADVDIRVIDKGIKIVINPDADKTKRMPNIVQTAFSEFFNNINMVREDINKQSRNLQAMNKKLIRKLNNLQDKG